MIMHRTHRRKPKTNPYAMAFQQLAQNLRREIHTDASLFGMVAHLIPHHPVFAAALCENIGRILAETSEPIDYVEVHIEAYRRTLFTAPDEDHGGPSLDLFEGDPRKAEEFAHNVQVIQAAGARILTAIPLAH